MTDTLDKHRHFRSEALLGGVHHLQFRQGCLGGMVLLERLEGLIVELLVQTSDEGIEDLLLDICVSNELAQHLVDKRLPGLQSSFANVLELLEEVVHNAMISFQERDGV